jgi:hypothetical protein
MTDPAPPPASTESSSRQRPPAWWIVVGMAVAIALIGLATAAKLSQRSEVPLATNGVGVGAVIATLVKDDDKVCLSDTVVPKGTGVVQLWLGYHDARPVTLSGTLTLRGGPAIAVEPTVVTATGAFQSLPLASTAPREARGVLCVERSGVGPQIDVGGASVSRRPQERPADVAGVSLGGVEPSLRLFAPAGTRTSAFQRVDDVLRHLSALSPSGLPPGLIALVAFVVLPAALALLLWNLVTAPRRSRRGVVALCVIGSLGITFTWATLTPIFQGPDEPEHFAYAQHLALSGERADPGRSLNRPPYSTQADAVYALLRNNAVVIDQTARQPWTAVTRADVNATDRLPGDDGGGFTESASGHSALYYAIVSPAIKLAGDGLPQQLYFARILSALLAALVAGFAALAASLLVPGRRRVAALAGLAAATLPIAGAVGGTINNDTLVNVIAAAAFTTTIAVLVTPKGGLWRYAVLGALIVLLPIAKITGLGVGTAFAGGLFVAALLRRQPVAILAALAAGAAGAVAIAAVLVAAAKLLVDGQTITLFNLHPPVPGAAGVPVPLSYKLDYILQLFVPFIHLHTDLYPPKVPLYQIYVRGSWGGFGWARFYLPTSATVALGLLTAAGVVAGLAALFVQRARVARHKLAMLAVALTPLIALVFVAYAYGNLTPRGVQPEQGRYLAIALAPVGLWFAALPGVLPEGRWRSLMTGVLAGGLCAICVAGVIAGAGGWAS